MASAHAVGRLNSSAGYADQRGKRACRLRRRGARPIARTVQMSASSPLASDCRAGAPRRLAPPVPRRALVRALGRATWPVGPRRGHSVSLARSHQTAAHWGARPLPTDLLSCRGARRLSAWAPLSSWSVNGRTDPAFHSWARLLRVPVRPLAAHSPGGPRVFGMYFEIAFLLCEWMSPRP